METKKTSVRRIAFIVFLFIFAGQSLLSALVQPAPDIPRLEPRSEALAFTEGFNVSDWRSLFSLAWWVSGGANAESAVTSFEPAVKELATSADSLDDRAKAELVLAFMHKKFLSAYAVRQSRLDTLFTTGRFNCISSAMLYAILASSLDLEVTGVMTHDHAFCSIKIAGQAIDVETTNPYGFDPGSNKEFHDAFGKVTGFAYVPPGNYRDRTPIDLKTLFSLVLSNEISDVEAAGRFSDAVGLAVDRWTLLGGGSGSNFEALVDCMINFGTALMREGRENDALDWSARATAVYGSNPKWVDFTVAAANNRIVKLIRAGQYTDAYSQLNDLRPRLSQSVAEGLAATIAEAELIAVMKATQNDVDENQFLTALSSARQAGIIPEDRIREIEIVWRLNRINRVASLEGWAAAYAATKQAIEELGSDVRLQSSLRIYRSNRIAELYNAAAAAYNAGNYAEAKKLTTDALKEFPDEGRFRSLLSTIERTGNSFQ